MFKNIRKTIKNKLALELVFDASKREKSNTKVSNISILLLKSHTCFTKNNIFEVAIPASVSPLLTVGTILVLTGLVGTFGTEALAGYGIGSRVEFLMIPLIFGIGTAMTSIVGANIGAKNIIRAETVGIYGGTSAGVVSIFIHRRL